MGLTSDRSDPKIHETRPGGQNESYLVLSDEERAKGFVRAVRRSYIHVGPPGPQYALRDLTPDQRECYDGHGYVKYEAYPRDAGALGRFWTQAQLDAVDKGCGAKTTMAQEIAETYARDPYFYGSTFCCACGKHLPVGRDGEFVWEGSDEKVGT
jgi:hypothetical protein